MPGQESECPSVAQNRIKILSFSDIVGENLKSIADIRTRDKHALKNDVFSVQNG